MHHGRHDVAELSIDEISSRSKRRKDVVRRMITREETDKTALISKPFCKVKVKSGRVENGYMESRVDIADSLLTRLLVSLFVAE